MASMNLRKIKFRLWDKYLKRMCDDKYTFALYLDGNYSVSDHIVFGNAWREREAKDFILIEWTGRKDTNGIDIYEGDIVEVIEYLNREVWEGHTHKAQVLFVDCHFVIKPAWIGQSINSSLKVIGNIFENGDLLNELTENQ